MYHKALRRSFEKGPAREFEQSLVEIITTKVHYLDNNMVVRVNTALLAEISGKATEDFKLVGVLRTSYEFNDLIHTTGNRRLATITRVDRRACHISQ